MKGIALILLEGEMRINHSHEGDLRITAHLHLKFTHEQVMEVLEKNLCDFSMEFAMFFLHFLFFDIYRVSCPSVFFFKGRAGRANKSKFDR